MPSIQEQVEQFVMDYGAREPLQALIRSFLEECCGKVPEYWREVLQHYFAWLLEK